MLVVKRRVRETITLILPSGREILIVLNEVGQGGARIGINAPQDVKIYRSELLERGHDASGR